MKHSFITVLALLLGGLFSFGQQKGLLFPSFGNESKTAKVGVLIPFENASQTTSENNLDFYCGILEAVRALGNEGYDITLQTHDYGRENFAVQALNAYDFIIGPVRSEDLEGVAGTLKDSTFVISPLDRKADDLANRYRRFIQAAPNQSRQWNELVRWSLEGKAHRDLNFIVIGNSNEYGTAQSIKSVIAEETADLGSDVSIRGCHCGVSQEIEGWHSAYDSTGTHDNIVIIASVNEAVLNNAVRNLAILSKASAMEVYCSGKVHSYSTINVEDLHKAGVRCVCPYYVDYRNEKVKEFSQSFRKHFKSRPSQFAFQGYDLAYHSIKSFCSNANGWNDAAYLEKCDNLLQANFQYTRVPGGGLVNNALRRLEYSRDFHLILHEAE